MTENPLLLSEPQMLVLVHSQQELALNHIPHRRPGSEHNKACCVIKVQLGVALPGTTNRKSINAVQQRAACVDNIIIALRATDQH